MRIGGRLVIMSWGLKRRRICKSGMSEVWGGEEAVSGR